MEVATDATTALAPLAAAVTTVVAAPSTATAGAAENIAVCIRVRPLNEREVRHKDAAVLRAIPAMSLVAITDADGQPLPGKHNVFQYDHIFDERASTRAMYGRVAHRIVKSSLDGINGTIFAYGQTSSGKTYTMTGTGGCQPFQGEEENDAPPQSESMGILQLAVEDIFGYIEQSTDRDFLLRVSFVEIYNEVIKDLLNPSEKGSNLKLREDPRKGVYVESKEEIITTYDEIMQLLRVGNQNRTVGTTAMNDKSSRSHSIFRIVIESKQKCATRRQSDDVNGAVLVASLNLVDLAGSESMRHTAAEGARQREAGNINKSLLTLSRVINSLATAGPSMQNAPFRDSKLTRLLQNSLDGNTRTLIICCVTPSDRYLEETKSTLQFAARAKNIQTSATVNEVLDDQAQLKRLKREVHELKKLVNCEAYNALKAENEALQNEQSKNKAEMVRLLGLMLSSSSEGVRGLASARNSKHRPKRTRETWCPGDFSANNLLKPLRTDFDINVAGLASPNPQPRKRRVSDDSKENVDPQNLMSMLDAAASDDDNDDDDAASRRSSSSSSRSRKRDGRAAAEKQVAELVDLLENAVSRTAKSRFDEDDDVPASGDLEARVMRLVSKCELLATTADQHAQLRGDHEVLKMATEELQMRLQLSKDQENEELANTKQLLDHVQNELAEERENLKLKDEEWQEEKEAWLSERKQMESTMAELRIQLEAMSSLNGVSEDVENSLRELTHENEVLKENLVALKQSTEEMQRTHNVKCAEMETNTKQEIEELSSQLQDAFVELEELKLEKQDEVAKLEEELLSKSEELEQRRSDFTAREASLLHELEQLKLAQSTDRKQEEEGILAKRCDELTLENERLSSERSNLMDAMVELEEQLQQTTKMHSDLEARVSCLTSEKANLRDSLSTLEHQLEELERERNSAMALGPDSRPSAGEQTLNRIRQLECELEQAQSELNEASNDQEAEANRADEAMEELERTKLQMEELVQLHAKRVEELSTEAERPGRDTQNEQVQRLATVLSEKDIQLQQAEAVAAEARSYRDFLQAEMDELSQKVGSLETAKAHFANENAHLRQQLTQLNTEMLQVPDTLAGEIEGLTERIESLRAELDTKIAHEKILTTEIKKLIHLSEDQEAQLADKAAEVSRLQEAIQALDEEKSAWFQKSASSDELQAELVRMREERWGLATKWEESEAALGKERRDTQRLAAELEDLRADRETIEEEKNKFAAAVAEKETKLRQLASELDATQTEKAALEEMVSELESKFEILEIAKKSLDDSLAVRVAEVATKSNENAELRAQLLKAEHELQALRETVTERQQEGVAAFSAGDLNGRVQELEKMCQEHEVSQSALEEELEVAKRAKSDLVEELSALESQLMLLSEEKMDLQSKLDAVASSLDNKSAASTNASDKMDFSTSSAGLEEVMLRLETETQRREKAELDAKSYEEALDMMRDDFKHKLDALKSSQLAVKESLASKENLEAELAKLRLDFARATEEQAELRYQSQQRLMSTQGEESVLRQTVDMLEQELSTSKETLNKTQAEWTARAQQAEQQFHKLDAELQAAKARELATREKLERVEEQLVSAKDALVETENEWKARAHQAEQHFRRLEEQLRSVTEERTKLAELSEQSTSAQSEVERLRSVNDALKVEKQQLEDEVASRERHWAERVDEVTRKLEFENSNLREQYQEAQDEVTAFKQFAERQITDLRASIEQNDMEMLEMSRIAKEREASLKKRIEDLEAKLEEMESQSRSLQVKLSEKEVANGELVAELSGKVEQLSQQLSEIEEERNSQAEQFTKLKTAMEKLEGEDYQHRNELEELSETLKSAQMEAVHYHSQLVEVQLAKEKLDGIVEVQQKRIDKLEQVKMTKDTLAVFQKLKSDRQSLQLQVEKLEAQLKDAAAAKALTKEAAEQQQTRLVRLKEEEVGMLKTHIEELKAHTEELKRAVQNEKDRNSHMRRELESVVEDIKGKAQQEVEDMRAVLKEKSEQVVELEVRIEDLNKAKHTMAAEKSSNESYLEKENLELLVEIRQLKKRLESRTPATSSSSYRSTLLDDDVAAFEASAREASALLAEPSAVSSFSSIQTPDAAAAKQEEETAAESASKKASAGLSGFLMPSSATSTDADEEEARPACSQQ